MATLELIDGMRSVTLEVDPDSFLDTDEIEAAFEELGCQEPEYVCLDGEEYNLLEDGRGGYYLEEAWLAWEEEARRIEEEEEEEAYRRALEDELEDLDVRFVPRG